MQKTIYIVAVNGKVSSEAYSTLEEAQDFIYSRGTGELSNRTLNGRYLKLINDKYTYEIHDVVVRYSK